jgi:beta-phosphoglucomutase-like phosphatase (HAD superfamily)
MPPSGALIFKLEQTFFRANPDYGEVLEVIRKEVPGEVSQQSSTRGLAPTMLELKKKLGKKAYEQVRLKAEAAAERIETQALGAAQMHPGVVKMLESVRDTGWWVVAASDMGKKPIAGFLKSNSLSQYMNLVLARSRLDEERLLAKSLRLVQTKLQTLTNSVYFCNSSREVSEAKALGMKCFVLPSPVEPFRTLYQAGPNGIILSLEEIPSLLSLPAMKLPAQGKPPAKKKKPRAGIKKVAPGITPKTP